MENENVEIQKPTGEDFARAFDKVDGINKVVKDFEEKSYIIDEIPISEEVINKSDDTTVRDLTKEESILKDLEQKRKEKKTFTEEEYESAIKDMFFVSDIMSRFNNQINSDAEKFLSATKKAEEWLDEDNSPNVLVKLILTDEKERMLFKELLLNTSEKRRPVYIDIGDYDFFFEYFDEDQPVFSFTRKSFDFFFNKDSEKLKEYIKENKCSFGLGFSSNERKIRFENISVEILDKNKKPVDEIKDETVPVDQVNEKKTNDEPFEIIYKKIYRVKTNQNEQLFVITDNPGTIYEKIPDVLSVKIIGNGVNID
jgi:hypothetical protein